MRGRKQYSRVVAGGGGVVNFSKYGIVGLQ